MSNRYFIVSAVRDEQDYINETIASISSQTIKPQQWIIVDDGSSDKTLALSQVAAQHYPWIRVLRRSDRGFRKPGAGVIQAFDEGYRLVHDYDWKFLVKLDGDLSFEPDYFEKCFRQFAKDPKLGIGGGTVCSKAARGPEAPRDPAFHVRGATKIYKRECWEGIGGLIQGPGWDTVDEYKANMLGWNTYTFPDVKIWHHRTTGKATGTWQNWVKNGLANYVAGYHPVFMSCKCGKRLFYKPYGIGALGLLVGFITGYLRGIPQVDDTDLIRYVRNQQMRKLLFRESLWDRKPL